MRILFSATPAHGHLLPLMPLIRAAAAAGHDVAVLTSVGASGVVAEELPGVPVLPAGPMPLEFSLAAAERTGMDVFRPTPELIGEIFAGSRLDLTIDEALTAARDWAPGLVIAEAFDTVGPMVAAVLRIGWHQFGIGPALPGPVAAALSDVAAPRYAARDLTPAAARSYLDSCPPLLQDPDWVPAVPRRPVRPRPHEREGDAWTAPAFAEPGRQRVLVTLGTVFSDARLLRDVVGAVSSAGVNVLAARGFALTGSADGDEPEPGQSPERGGTVRYVPFVPIARLLDGMDAVVGVGGSGTVLAALARGIPLVLWPQGAEQPVNAARAAAAGAALVVDGLEEISAAVASVLTEDRYRLSAQRAAAQIADLPAPEQVINDIVAEAQEQAVKGASPSGSAREP
jgi:UDP:flavonoid glycosyltransferase YjiC (YdhE family)